MRTQPRHRARTTGAHGLASRRWIAAWSAFWLAAVAVVSVSSTAQAAEPVANDDSATTVANTAAYILVVRNDSDPDFDNLQVTGTSDPDHGSVSCTPAGICVYVPDQGFVGSDTFSYDVSDGTDSASANVTITVTPPVAGNRPPTAVDDEFAADSGVFAFVQVLDNDTDPDNDALQVNSASEPAHGTVECTSSVYCVYTSDAGYRGPDAFTYVVADRRGGTDVGAVALTVGGENHDPVAVDDELTTREGAAARSVNVVANDSDEDGDPLTAELLAPPENGTASCDDDLCRYAPDAGYTGADTFTYTVSDGRGGTDSATVHVEVAVNHPPIAVDDEADAVQGVVLPLELLSNDSDEDGDRLRLTGTTDPDHGDLSCDANGFCDYTADADYAGADSFSYDVSDGVAASSAEVSITVTEPCPPATCIDNGTIAMAVHPEGHLNVRDGSGSVAGPGPVGLTYLPTGNEATAPGCLCEGWGVADAASGVTGYVSGETDKGANNLSVQSFQATASTATSVVEVGDELRVTHDFHPSPRTPNLYEIDVTIQNLTEESLDDIRYRRVTDWDVEPTVFSEYVTIQGGDAEDLLFDSDHGFVTANPLGERPSIAATGDFVDSGPIDHGALMDFGFGALGAGATRSFTIYYGAAATENAAERALNSVGAEVYSLAQPDTEDGATLGTPNTFMVAYSEVGGSPIFGPDAVDDTLSVDQDATGSVDVLANDTDPNGDTLSVTTAEPAAEHGAVTCSEAGACTYTPDAGFTGADAFEYDVSDGNGGSDSATVAVTVVPVEPGNADPQATDDELTTDAGSPGSVDVLANDSDPDGDDLAVTTPSPAASNGDVTCTASGTCTYTPAAGFSGSDSFEYAVSDGNGGSATATVAVSVMPVAGQLDLTLSADQTDVQYSDPLDAVRATTTGGGSPADTLLSATGLPAAVILSDNGDGTADVGGVVTVGRGSYSATVHAVNGAESVDRPLGIAVVPESAEVEYSGSRSVDLPDGHSTVEADLAATITQQDDGSPGDISRARVYFDLYAADNQTMATPDLTVGPVAPGNDGVASTVAELTAGVWTVVVRFDQTNDYFTGAAADEVELSVESGPVVEGQRAWGAGWVGDRSERGHHHHWWKQKKHHHGHHHRGHHHRSFEAAGRFCISWRLDDDASVHGAASYTFQGPDGRRYLLRSTDLGRVTFGDSADGLTSTAKGFGSLVLVDGASRHKRFDPVGRVWFRIDVIDGASEGDRFAIGIWKDGERLHQVGRPADPQSIKRGAIVIT